MSLKAPALAAALSVALVLATPGLAWADDEAPTPQKIRIKLKDGTVKLKDGTVEWEDGHVKLKQGGDAEAAKTKVAKSPMATIHKWLAGQMGGATKATDPHGMLAAWFDGGADVPLAGLRDALKADGWNADKLVAWMHGKAGEALPGMLRMLANMGPAFGGASGARRGPWSAQGPGQMFGPRQGRSWGGQGARRGSRFGRGMRGFPGRGGGMHGAPHGRAQTQSRAYIMWNDGSGWQRRELPGGMQGFPGRQRGPGVHGRPFFGRGGGQQGQRAGAGGRAHGMDPDVLKSLLEHLRQSSQAGQASANGNEAIEKIFMLLRGGPSEEDKRAGAVDALPWMEFPGHDGSRKIRVKIPAPKKAEAVKEVEIEKVKPVR